MTAWEDLVGVALLGTRRRAPDLGALPPAVRELAGERADPADALLTAGALLTAYRRAGWQPEGAAETLPVAETDHRPYLPDAARERLARLLTASRPELLAEWLGVVAARGLRVPPERLPALAESARAKPALRGPVALVAGPAGRWLAGLNPEWRFLTAAAPEPGTGADDWRFGSPAQRRSWLAVALVADPEGARAAFLGSWESEPAEVRATVLELLGEHLRAEDEPFLEAALGDRAASVRQLASALLARVPGSALGRRMAERLRPLIHVREDVLEVEVPDGDTRWLRQVVAATPPEFWAEFGTPAELVRLSVRGAPASVLREGWTVVAVRHRDARWAKALFDADPGRADAGTLIQVLAPPERAKVLARLIRQARPEAVARLVVDLPAPWPPEVGTVLLDWLAGREDTRAVAHAAVTIARTVPPECLGHPLATTAPEPGSAPWRRALAETLNFRREMYEELA
ncbi:DUF5691 domain-containing protein [Amycolatopsis sp. 195334CR]|uniref:DUF5691 domain-containing protein n=1 Tax=Amycolatopsis sp. 195334CR TaxID=2814588 RepID=UPI001A8E48EF|nr:DUF5691 domain-containing protein [Amycolatopsis sp. 195334CR]MBN6041336.1 hypothetical protein [Amycolatopsis sp. 195334CR]